MKKLFLLMILLVMLMLRFSLSVRVTEIFQKEVYRMNLSLEDGKIKVLKINNKYAELKKYQYRSGLDANDDFIICMFYLKELLHDFMIRNLQWFLSEIYQNHYKKVDEYKQPIFLDNLYKEIMCDNKYKALEYFLEKIDRTVDLSFIYDGMDSQINSDKTFIMLVDSMSSPYQNYITTFPQSKLYFDSGMENVFLESQK